MAGSYRAPAPRDAKPGNQASGDERNGIMEKGWLSRLFSGWRRSEAAPTDQKATLPSLGGFGQIRSGQTLSWTDWDTATGIRKGFRASSWVYACVNAITSECSVVPWIAQTRESSSSEWRTEPDHPLATLIEYPHRYISRGTMITRIIQQLYLGGNALLHIVRGVMDAPLELEPLNPDVCRPIPDEVDYLAGYSYRPRGSTRGEIRIPARDIIHFQFPDPANPLWGMSPLRALGKILDAESDAVSWWRNSMLNRCTKDGLLSFKRRLTKAQWREIWEQYQSQHGGSQNARGVMILGDDATFTPYSWSPAEFDFLNSRKFMRDEIISVMKVPPPIIGILTEATYANIKEARRIMWLDVNIPLLDLICEEFNRVLVPQFGDRTTLRLTYDLSNVDALQRDYLEKCQIAQILWRMGVPFNAINRRLNLGFDDIEGGDTGFLPSAVTPLAVSDTEQQQPVTTVRSLPENGPELDGSLYQFQPSRVSLLDR
jgi:HK97 family phage portal protein